MSDITPDFFITINKKQSMIQFTGEINAESMHDLKDKFMELVNAFKKNETRLIHLFISSGGG